MKSLIFALLKIGAALSVAVMVLLYGLDVRARHGATECERVTSGNYIGEVCYIPREYGALFRLYESKSGRLLAERTYYDPEPPHMFWHSDYVHYDITDEDGYVRLPPTWLDRLRAKLP